jgi:FlaA1/EpsC-like NDP-sugar epimerase
VATKKRPVAAPDEMDFAAMAPNVNYLPYGLLLSQYEEIKRRMQGAGQFPVRLRDLDECVESRPAWIWGAGRGGCKALPQLQAARIEISGFIDSDPTKCGSHFMGLPVAAPDFIARSGCKAYVFIASIHAAAIERQLESYGFRRIRDYFTIF